MYRGNVYEGRGEEGSGEARTEGAAADAKTGASDGRLLVYKAVIKP